MLYDEMETIAPLTTAEQQLLSNLSVLPAENLPYALLKTLLTPNDAKQFSSTFTNLARRGWLEMAEQDKDSFYKISPVVQEITRHKNQTALWAHCKILIDNLIEKLDYQPGVGHLINTSYDEAELYCRYAENASACFSEPSENLALLYERMGRYHRTTGDLLQSLRCCEKYYQLKEVIYDANPDNVGFKNNLAIPCIKLGLYYEQSDDQVTAKKYYEQSIDLLQTLVREFPHYVEFQKNLDWVTARLAQLEQQQD